MIILGWIIIGLLGLSMINGIFENGKKGDVAYAVYTILINGTLIFWILWAINIIGKRG